MRHTLHIDEEHIKAILAEVGERLRIILWMGGRQKVPRPIRQSLDRLAEVDDRTAVYSTVLTCQKHSPKD